MNLEMNKLNKLDVELKNILDVFFEKTPCQLKNYSIKIYPNKIAIHHNESNLVVNVIPETMIATFQHILHTHTMTALQVDFTKTTNSFLINTLQCLNINNFRNPIFFNRRILSSA
jgi:hypothetical protein